jgi:hypothetical protein
MTSTALYFDGNDAMSLYAQVVVLSNLPATFGRKYKISKFIIASEVGVS